MTEQRVQSFNSSSWIRILNNYLRNFVSHFDVLVDYRIGLARTGRTQDHRRTEGVDKVNPSVIRPSPEPEAGAEIDRILVLLQFGFLHEGFVLDVEHVFEQVGLQQA